VGESKVDDSKVDDNDDNKVGVGQVGGLGTRQAGLGRGMEIV
jgi:hypothetical protein